MFCRASHLKEYDQGVAKFGNLTTLASQDLKPIRLFQTSPSLFESHLNQEKDPHFRFLSNTFRKMNLSFELPN